MKELLITWTEEYNIDGAIIDSQHQKLISLINRLYKSFSEGKANDEIGKIIDELIDYTVFHFSTEEEFFDRVNYIDKDVHIAQHNDFINKTKLFNEKFMNREDDLSYDIMDFLRDWLQNHILGSDKKYVPYL